MKDIIIALFINVLGELVLKTRAIKETIYIVNGTGKASESTVVLLLGNYRINLSVKYYDNVDLLIKESEEFVLTEDKVMFLPKYQMKITLNEKMLYDLSNHFIKQLQSTNSIDVIDDVKIKHNDGYYILMNGEEVILKETSK